jgi:hypothetical protein
MAYKRQRSDARMNKKERKENMSMKEKAEKRIMAELEPVDLEQLYRDMLDECEPEVKVAGLSFCASRIVEELDPVAFRCGVCDYADSLVNDSITEEIGGNHYDWREAENIVEEVEAEEEELENA